jgi:queuine tRNA-ribosyltransferase
MKTFHFEIQKKSKEVKLARAGTIHTAHGDIQTPAFIAVGTKATVKALSSEQVRDDVRAQAVLANTYHLYLQPGDELVKEHGGFPRMMNWKNSEGKALPSFTDSGGFQVFSLGQALGHGVSKIATSEEISKREIKEHDKTHEKLAKIDDDGVTFKSVIDGSEHRFTPEKSMQIQHNLGADIFFAFDECTSPLAPIEYQRKSLQRTHAWAKRSLDEHKRLGVSEATGEMQALFGVVQGGSFEELRRESARVLGSMDFDGYGIGGSFTKEDMGTAVRWVCEELPEGKPRHLLGIGEPIDILLGIENGIDTFDCVAPTRIARNGALYTYDGRINITNTKYQHDMSPLIGDESWYTHRFTKAYLAHLFRADEMTGATIASIHNLRFLVELTEKAREALLAGTFFEFKENFVKRYYKNK